MSEEIIKVLDNLAQKFGIAIDWTSQNVMPYLQDLVNRFITYRNATATMQIVLAIILIISGTVVFIKLCKWTKKDTFDTSYNDDEMLFVLGATISILAIIAGIVLVICNIAGIIQNIYMPELTIIEYIKSFQ